ncbi:mannitol dehydrogenase family protein [Streptomyces sp. SAI-127]|uniref:mannitol dehydrogenase family protein n=1 Tax=Streptomyces sp. SAI-127 TaxID=2940543 RepID=UPI0024761EF1|nr:mannitol dehydrogenase family protein [Streptomyces sp. SAI-127]MDH6492259.1 fructuronate reductase [Streptomyces sp. SAI-127]
MSETLSRTTVSALAPELRPLVDPAELHTRVVHFGLGAFHRAHQAVYTERAAALSGEPWGITAVAPRSARTARALREQDCLYSLTERRPDGNHCRVVGSVVDALAMGPDAEKVDALLTDPAVTVVTLTVTEKGYQRSPFSPVIERLATGLAARMRAGAPPVSVVSCDNMADNGAVLEGVLRDFVQDCEWPDRSVILDRMAEAVVFPATVVDRIVPATSEADRAGALDALGLEDALPVTGEPYRQWVLEDSFAGPRPPWERDGALLVPDVTPYQLTKLRLLNGSHSALACLGMAAGLDTIAETMASDWGEHLVRALCAEVSPTLPAGGPDPLSYADALVVRFRNPAMRHLLRQIGTDGPLKVRERWLPALRDLRGRGAATPVLELALAAWALPAQEPIPALLRSVGAADLADDESLTAAVTDRLPALRAGRIEI